MSRWISIDDYFAAAGESWATVGNTRPGADHYRSPRDRPVDEHQEHADHTAAAPLTDGACDVSTAARGSDRSTGMRQ